MADGTRFKTIENQIVQLTETVTVQFQHQLRQLTDTVTSHNTFISDTAASLVRMESLITSLDQKSVTHGPSQVREQPFHVRNVRLEFPRFDGTDALAWIFKADQFFDYYNTPDPERLTIAAVHLDQTVVPWFQMVQRNFPFRSWQEFTKAIELEFGPSVFERPRSALFKLTQSGSVGEYYLTFTALANRVTGLNSEAVLDCFISGLQPELQREVISQSPTSLMQVVSIARLFETEFQPIKPTPQTSITKIPGPFTPGPNRNMSSQGSTSNTPIRNTPPILPNPSRTSTNNRAVKNISPTEMQLRREKGLCYNCDEKFSFRHRCPNKHLYLLQLDDPNPDEPDPLTYSDSNLSTNPPNIEPELHLSLNALNGSTKVGTLRFTGTVDGVPLQILVDGGNSDNFFQPRLARFLQLPIEPAPGFNVLVGNGQSIMAEGQIPQLTIEVQGQVMVIPVFLLPFSGAVRC